MLVDESIWWISVKVVLQLVQINSIVKWTTLLHNSGAATGHNLNEIIIQYHPQSKIHNSRPTQ